MDHPRVGGEKQIQHCRRECFLGSPPRGRGKAVTGHRGPRHLGITPAWAGKRPLQKGDLVKNEDHPRVGGEKSASMMGSERFIGSPPRGRGKVARFMLAKA